MPPVLVQAYGSVVAAHLGDCAAETGIEIIDAGG